METLESSQSSEFKIDPLVVTYIDSSFIRNILFVGAEWVRNLLLPQDSQSALSD